MNGTQPRLERYRCVKLAHRSQTTGSDVICSIKHFFSVRQFNTVHTGKLLVELLNTGSISIISFCFRFKFYRASGFTSAIASTQFLLCTSTPEVVTSVPASLTSDWKATRWNSALAS